MRNVRFVFGILTVFLFGVGAFAQTPEMRDQEGRAYLQENIDRVAANYHGYEFHPLAYTPAPKGYKPFYISHYGRHGSRLITYSSAHKYVIQKLTELDKAGLLSQKGSELLVHVKRQWDWQEPRQGKLTAKGAGEHDRLARNLYASFKPVFKGRKAVREVSSVSDRCHASMRHFTAALRDCNRKLTFDADSAQALMAYIMVTPPDSIVHDRVKPYLDSLYEHWLVPEDAIAPLVTNLKKAMKIMHHPVKFERYLHVVCSIAQNFDPTPMYEYLPFEEAYKLWSIKNANLYFNHCNSAPFGDLRMPYASTLVKDFVEKADECLDAGRYCADLRFGHDWGLIALASWMGIDGFDERLTRQNHERWKSGNEVSMASNIQWVFYRNRKGDILVKFIYNERERTIPALEAVNGVYYRWSEVRPYLLGRFPDPAVPNPELTNDVIN